MKRDMMKKYGLEQGRMYEPMFRYDDEVSGTDVILSCESAAEFAEAYSRKATGGQLLFEPVNAKEKRA